MNAAVYGNVEDYLQGQMYRTRSVVSSRNEYGSRE